MFKVYDDQDSGNICFGTEKDGQRYFIKFAGAPTERYNGNRDRWQLSDKLFEVAAKAVSADRNGRQQSIRQLREEWEMAICMES